MLGKVCVEFETQEGILSNSIDDINNLVKSVISVQIPIVNSEGKETYLPVEYTFYVGKVLEINDEKFKDMEIQNLKQQGVTKLVNTKFGFRPVTENTQVFETPQSLMFKIQEICAKYDKIGYDVAPFGYSPNMHR